MVQVHHRLGRARADDPRQGPAVEIDHVFAGAGGNQDAVALDVLDFVADAHRHFLAVKEAGDCRTEHDLDADGFRFFEQLLADVEAAHFGLVFLGAEKFMNLFKQLAAWSGIFIEDDGLDAAFCRFNGCGKPCRSGADNNHIVAFYFHLTRSFLLIPRIGCGHLCLLRAA